MYDNFADVYDKLMYDVDYKAWADFIEGIFKKNGITPSIILDLGCGTGSFCIEMANRGYDMIGVDISAEMLSRASFKSSGVRDRILYLNQDMTEFELYGTVDVVACLMDSINYLLNKKDIKKMFKLVKNYLNPGGLFIFDINTEYKLENVLGNNVFYDIGDEIAYLWQNSYDKRKRTCEFDLTFFVKQNEAYMRFDENHTERAFSVPEIKELIEFSGFELVSCYNELKFSPPKKSSERIFFVCKKGA